MEDLSDITIGRVLADYETAISIIDKFRVAAEQEAEELQQRISRKGPRRRRMPKLDAFLEHKLADGARHANEELLMAIPTSGDLYRQGSGKTALVVEVGGGRLFRDAFDRRVTKARKLARAKVVRR